MKRFRLTWKCRYPDGVEELHSENILIHDLTGLVKYIKDKETERYTFQSVWFLSCEEVVA